MDDESFRVADGDGRLHQGPKFASFAHHGRFGPGRAVHSIRNHRHGDVTFRGDGPRHVAAGKGGALAFSAPLIDKPTIQDTVLAALDVINLGGCVVGDVNESIRLVIVCFLPHH